MPSNPGGPKPLRRQLVAILLAAVLPLLLALGYFTWRETGGLRTNAEHHAMDLATFAARDSERFLAQTEALLAGLARREDIRRLDSLACGPVFATFADQNPHYANLLSIDAAGGVVCSAMPLSKPLPMKIGPPYLVDQMKTKMGFLVGRVEHGFISRRWVVPIAYPIRDGDRLIGMVAVSIDLAQFDPFFSRTSELNVRLTLLDENGSVLSDSLERARALGRQLSDDTTQRMLAAGEGLMRGAGFDGVDRIHGFSRIQGAGWTAVASIGVDSVVEPMLADVGKLVVFATGMLGISLILGGLLIRRIEGASTSLVATARSVAAGRVCDRVDAIPVAELNEVGEQFNRMLDKLAAEHQALEESRVQRMQVYQASPDAIAVSRLEDGVILEANQAFYDMSGFEESEVVGRTSLDIGFIRDVAARRRIVERLRRDGKIANEGFWGVCKDGSRRYFLFSSRLVTLGGAECEVAVMRDTTEARRTQIALRENEARFQALTKLSSDWYWEQDADFRFTRIAGPLYEHTGIPPEAHLGRTRWEVPSRGMTEEAWQRHKAQLQRHEPFRNLEMQRIGANGEAHWVSISGEPVFDSLGVFCGYRGVGRDITERKRQQFVAELGSRVLEMSARRLPLDIVLDTIARELEANEPAMLCSILLLDADGRHLRHGAGPSLAEEYNRAIDGVAIGPTVGSCGTAAYTRQEVVVSDIANDPLWADFRHLALPHGLRACWSTPIFSASRDVLGTFAVYFREPRVPRPDEEHTVARAAELASVVIERDRFEAELLRLSRAIEQSPVSIVITDTKGRIEYVNPKFVDTTGYSADEVRGLNPSFLKSGETSAEEYARLWQAITHGREWSGELHNRRKDGTLFWERAHIMPVVTPAGKTINYLAVKEDITVRKAAEAALRALALERDRLIERLQLEFDHMPIGFAVTDPELRIVDWNPAMERIFGYSREEAVGANMLDLVMREIERPFAERHVEEIRRSGRTITVTSPHRTKRGVTIVCEWTDTPLFDAEGRFLGAMSMVQDISEKKALEDRDRQRQAQFLHSARLVTMGELASTMAHELNQPLTAIANFSGVALRRLPATPETQAARDVIEMIAVQALRAGEIVWRMRDFVRTGETSFKPLDVNAVIMELAGLAGIQARDLGVIVHYELGQDLSPVRGNRVQVEQVLLNLVKNGIESMDREDCGKLLVVQTRQTDRDEVEISVTDEGCGLPEDKGQAVFASFFTTKADGLGLGLPISRSIVEAHGGRLWHAANAGRGTSFTFTLPVWRDDDAND